MTPPCKDCKDRVVGCHAKCERYAKWRVDHAKEKDQYNKSTEFDRYLHGTKMQNIADWYAKQRRKNKNY